MSSAAVHDGAECRQRPRKREQGGGGDACVLPRHDAAGRHKLRRGRDDNHAPKTAAVAVASLRKLAIIALMECGCAETYVGVRSCVVRKAPFCGLAREHEPVPRFALRIAEI